MVRPADQPAKAGDEWKPSSMRPESKTAYRRHVNRRHVIGIVTMFLVSRAALVAVGLATKLSQGERLHFPADLVELFVRWDAGWYLGIVEHGYLNQDTAVQPGATSYAFCPVFPLLVRLVARVTDLPPPWAALIVSNSAFLAALFVVFAYGRRIGLGDRAAVYATALLTVTPGSFIFSAPYSESVFLLLLATAMLCTIGGRFWAAGLAAAVLSAVRLNGFLFAVFPAVTGDPPGDPRAVRGRDTRRSSAADRSSRRPGCSPSTGSRMRRRGMRSRR